MIEEILKERGDKYGPFHMHANITQCLKEICKGSLSWSRMNWSQKEALEMIMHKVGRIINGDPNYADSWADIAGYAQLVVKELEKEQGN